MCSRTTRCSGGTGRFWRQVIGIAVAYTFVIQGLLSGIVGAQLATSSSANGLAGFELCLGGAADATGMPTDPAHHQNLEHCIVCFASAHFTLAAPVHSSVGHDCAGRGVVLAAAVGSDPSNFSEYSIARPRGPPISA
jgi:hypothetical protein